MSEVTPEMAENAKATEGAQALPPAEREVEQAAVFHVDDQHLITLAWPHGQPEAVMIPSEMLIGVVNDMNLWRELANLQATALATIALGNRPSGKIAERIADLQGHFGIR